jgi:putative oxidoreductase
MNTGLLLLRLVLGLSMAAHGSQKLFGWFGGPGIAGISPFMETIGFRPGRRHALASGVVEFAGGLLLALGLATPLAAALIASVMVVAAATVHGKNGFFAQNGGYELNLLIGVAALSIAFTGPGAWSLDALAGFVPEGNTWGAIATLVAIAGSVGQLAQRRVDEQPARTDRSQTAVSHAH